VKKNDVNNPIKGTITIKQLADLVHLPVSKVRFWADNGFIRREKNPENGYYQYNLLSLGDLIYIKSYRDIGFSFDNMPNAHNSRNKLPEIFSQLKQRLTYQISALNNCLDSIRLKENLFYKAISYDGSITEGNPPFEAFNLLSFQSAENFSIDDAATYNVIKNGKIAVSHIGYVSNKYEKSSLWQKRHDARYFHYLINHKDNDTADVRTQALERVTEIEKQGFAVTALISKFLIAFFNDEKNPENLCNYFSIWIEAYPK
jgi:DNA-binding transcriptional MerR regulator